MKKKQTTIRDIARQLGISHSTVSRALSENPKESALVTEKTRKRVEQKAAEMDYRPNLIARGISTGKTGTLGLLTYEISHEPSSCQTDQIMRAADRQNYQIVMGLAPNLLHVQQLLSRGIDGLLIHTRGYIDEPEHILNAVEGRVPVVTFHDPLPNLSGVVLDDIAGFFDVTEHLIRLGHERIGFIGSAWNRNVVGSAKARGYLLAMQKHGLIPKRIPGRTFLAQPAHQLSKGLSTESFTAFVCRDDYVAIDVCRGLGELGLRVPEDVAVVGNDDINVAARMTPALTTLATPFKAIAEMAMELMQEQLQGQDEPRQITLQSPLVVRESCGVNNNKK